jgi:transposase InsO family protein
MKAKIPGDLFTQNLLQAPEVRQSVFMYLETYYNRIRIHSALDYLAPHMFNSGQVA